MAEEQRAVPWPGLSGEAPHGGGCGVSSGVGAKAPSQSWDLALPMKGPRLGTVGTDTGKSPDIGRHTSWELGLPPGASGKPREVLIRRMNCVLGGTLRWLGGGQPGLTCSLLAAPRTANHRVLPGSLRPGLVGRPPRYLHTPASGKGQTPGSRARCPLPPAVDPLLPAAL